jgi:hypothetical protein
MDHEQLRLGPELIAVMRAGVTIAIERGAQFVAPPHLLLALLADARVGPVIAPLLPRERISRAATDAARKLPGLYELPEGLLPDGERVAFQRYDTLAFRSSNGARTLFLDADAYHLFLEGARRAGETYHPKHLVMGFTAESVKDRELLSMIGPDPVKVTMSVSDL